MATTYHINNRGRILPCSAASPATCKFGGDTPHFASESEAEEYISKEFDTVISGESILDKARAVFGRVTDSSAYQEAKVKEDARNATLREKLTDIQPERKNIYRKREPQVGTSTTSGEARPGALDFDAYLKSRDQAEAEMKKEEMKRLAVAKAAHPSSGARLSDREMAKRGQDLWLRQRQEGLDRIMGETTFPWKNDEEFMAQERAFFEQEEPGAKSSKRSLGRASTLSKSEAAAYRRNVPSLRRMAEQGTQVEVVCSSEEEREIYSELEGLPNVTLLSSQQKIARDGHKD